MMTKEEIMVVEYVRTCLPYSLALATELLTFVVTRRVLDKLSYIQKP